MLKKNNEKVIHLADELESITLLKKIIEALRHDEIDELILIARHTVPYDKYSSDDLKSKGFDFKGSDELQVRSKLYMTFFGNRHVSDLQGLLVRMNNLIDRYTNGETIHHTYNEVGD